jgi:hypothetical protein
MDLTTLVARIVGPVLLVRGVSIVIDRQHFVKMVQGLDHEIHTVSFSLFPIALMMVGIALVLNRDLSTTAGLLIYLMAWGAILKSAGLILMPRVMAAKARALANAGFISVVLVVCFVVGGYFTWFGYFN